MQEGSGASCRSATCPGGSGSSAHASTQPQGRLGDVVQLYAQEERDTGLASPRWVRGK